MSIVLLRVGRGELGGLVSFSITLHSHLSILLCNEADKLEIIFTDNKIKINRNIRPRRLDVQF